MKSLFRRCWLLKSLAGGALLLNVLSVVAPSASAGEATKKDYPIQPVDFTHVQFHDSFWARREDTNRTVTIPFAFQQCEETGRIDNFSFAAHKKNGTYKGYTFNDSDVYKIIEGASYTLAQKADPKLDSYLDDLIAKIAAAQEADGYLYAARTTDPANAPEMAGKERWVNLQWSHELYNVGHLYEAAVAHYLATGKKNFLQVALKNADFLVREFGTDKRRAVPGHQEVEIGLVKLFRATGEEKYLRLAKFFLDERGNAKGHELYGEYAQDHLPVLEQSEAVGHAVRACYMYAGMADVAALTGDPLYIQAIDRIWEDVVQHKLYLTGGIGAVAGHEGFGPAYALPNNAYAETCAAIAAVLWNHRMFLLHGEAKYIDVLERILYNGAIDGVSLDGKLFFYPNPLVSFGQDARSPWFGCACCPTNITRFLPSVPGYVYAVAGEKLYINLYVQGSADCQVMENHVHIEQSTDYPWSGEIRIQMNPDKSSRFTLLLRIPGWAQGQVLPGDLYHYLNAAGPTPVLKVNGRPVPFFQEKGYVHIVRAWSKGDTVELNLSMPVRRVVANDKVEADRGRVAVERGPFLYCVEWPDNNGRTSNLQLPDGEPLKTEAHPELLNGVTVITGQALAYRKQGNLTLNEKQCLVLIPYYAWAHRGQGEMAVWLARDPAKVRVFPEPTLASQSRASTSGGKRVEAIHNQFDPESSNDQSTGVFHWWPKKGTAEWVQYDFKGKATVSEVSVFWFDDGGDGECRVPRSWQILYLDADQWLPVKSLDAYGSEKDRYNLVRFEPVTTTALKLEVQLPEKFSSGILEWKVK